MVQTWSNDTYESKMLKWIKNYEVWLQIGHGWLFPQYSWFLGQLSNWLGRKIDSRLETWYEQPYRSNMKYESNIRHWKSKNPCANSNPNFRSSVQGDVLSWANPSLVLNPKRSCKENLDKIRGKILGYNRCPCAIFLDLKS